MSNSASIELLTDRLTIYDPDVRLQVMMALSRRRYHARNVRRIQSDLRSEADTYARLLAIQRDLGGGSGLRLLKDGLNALAQQTIERMLYLLSFVYDSEMILRAREALLYGSGTTSKHSSS